MLYNWNPEIKWIENCWYLNLTLGLVSIQLILSLIGPTVSRFRFYLVLFWAIVVKIITTSEKSDL